MESTLRNRLRIVASIAILCLATMSLASDPNEVLRPVEKTYKVLQLTKSEMETFKKIDTMYARHLDRLRKQQPVDYTLKRDQLNELFTREYMKPMTPEQKSSYRKFIRQLRTAFVKSHSMVDPDSIFIWGGANLL